MITILTTTSHQQQIKDAIGSIDRLIELVQICTDPEESGNANKILQVNNESINTEIDWNDTEAPYVLPSIRLTTNNLLALVFHKLENHQKSFSFLSEKDTLYQHLIISTHLQLGYNISEEQYDFAKEHDVFNACIINHYGDYHCTMDANGLKKLYQQSLILANNDEIKIFKAKHYIQFLITINELDEAFQLVISLRELAISEEAINTLQVLHASILMAGIHIPYDQDVLQEILDLQQKSIAFYKKKNLKVNAGLLLIDASEIANFQDNYMLSKTLIDSAIQYFRDEDIPVFLGNAIFRKAILLYTWSKNGSPQYYKPAINAFQNALKIFKRDTHPQQFADIHHNLALIYSEIKVSQNEKPIWTAFCASSFKETLKFYTKEQFPYEHAMVSHNYATALMGFPEAKLHNNLNKAFNLFEEALTIRTKKTYPFERALTLLNQIELYWLIHNEDHKSETQRYKYMVEKAKEIKMLVSDEALLNRSDEHLIMLKELKVAIE